MPSFSGESVGAIHATLELDRDEFARGLAAARDQVRRFEAERHQVAITAATGQATAEMDSLRARMRSVTDRTYELRVKIAEAGIDAELKKLEARLKVATRERNLRIKVSVDSGALTRLRAMAQQHFKDIKWHGVTAMQGIGTAAVVMGPQLLGSLGAATLGAGALGVAGAGAGLSFGALGLAVKNALTTQGQYAANVRAVSTAQKALTKDLLQGQTSTLAVAKAQQALVKAHTSGNATMIASAQQHLAIVTASANSQMANNAALIRADKLRLATAQQNAQAYNHLAQQVKDHFAALKDSLTQTLAPAVNQVFHGMLTAMGTVKGALPGLQAPFLALGTAVHQALSSPATQAGIRALIDGFGKMVKASAPLVGPIMQGVIALGKVFLNIARAAMPALVGEVQKVAGWLGKVAGHTANTAHLRDVIGHMVKVFNGWVDSAIKLGGALAPLFTSAAGFKPLLDAVIAIVGGFTHLLEKLGPVGRLFLGGLGLALISSRFLGIAKAISPVVGLVGKLGPLMTALLPALSAAGAAMGPLAADFLSVAAAAAPYLIAIGLVVGAVLLVIKYHKQIGKAIEAAWNFIKTVVTAVVGAVVDVVKKGWELVKTVVTTVGKAIGDAVSTAWHAIKKVVTTIVKGVEGVVTDAWHGLEKVTSTVWDTITGALSDAWKAIKHGVSVGVKAVVHVVTTLPGKALDALGDIASTLWDAGVKLVEGFINGIISMFGKVASVAGHLVDTVTGAIGGLLGIHSPSVVAHGWGEMVGAGLVNGLSASQAHVTAAAQRLAAAVRTGLGGPIGLQANLGVSGPPALNLGGGSAASSSGLAVAGAGGGQPTVVVTIGAINSQSLVPGSHEDLRRIAHTVTEALRRTGPAIPPRHA